MKITIHEHDGTIRFTGDEGVLADVFRLGILKERLKGTCPPTHPERREVVVEKDKLIEFLTR